MIDNSNPTEPDSTSTDPNPAPDSKFMAETSIDDTEELSLEDADRPITLEETPLTRVATFDEAGVHPEIRKAVEKLGWKAPTEIQGYCLPFTLHGRDLAGFAQTGTGKTGVFLITSAHRILTARDKGEPLPKPSCIILTPTRELAMQVEQDAQGLFQSLGIKSLAVFGGVDYEKQAKALREGVDVVVATPGRLKDYTKKKVLDLSSTSMFVCDEADRMFDMGFIEDVVYFFDRVPENAQKLLFSATTNDSVKELAFEYLNKPEYISATPESITPDKIEQHAIICEAKQKLRVMLGLLQDHNPKCSIIFTNTKIAAEWLHYKLQGNGLDTDLITGDLPQRKRISLIKRIKDGQVKALIATDVASRGLHISDVTHVYNFDLPDDASNYVHRIGRTARAGARGFSYSLVCEDYGDNLKGINDLLGNELALRALWYDERYDRIEDKAGDPFADKSSRLGRASEKTTSGRHERSGATGGDKKQAGGGKTVRAPRKKPHDSQDKHQHSRNGNQRKGRARGPGHNYQEDSAQRQSRRNEHKTKRTYQERRGHKRRDERRPQELHQMSKAAKSPEVDSKSVAAEQTIGSIMKKFIRTIFGRKEKQ